MASVPAGMKGQNMSHERPKSKNIACGDVVPGCAFTVEPGLYDEEAGIGIRIEDVVVITETGCEVISDLVPKERAEVEALVAEEGVLDWLGSRRE